MNVSCVDDKPTVHTPSGMIEILTYPGSLGLSAINNCFLHDIIVRPGVSKTGLNAFIT